MTIVSETENPTPVCVFTYNRPEHTRRTLESLAKNAEAKGTLLYVFSDGPKTPEAVPAVEEVRKILQCQTSLFREVRLHFRDKNLGLAPSIITGVTQVLAEHQQVIVLEDDMVTSPYFLRYMNAALRRYASDDRVISVHAYVYPTRHPLSETFFLRGADCWGWGTWKRGWDLFNPDGAELWKDLQARNLVGRFDFDSSYPYSEMLQNQIAGRNQSWAIRWYASAFLANKLTLYPGHSLVKNIGLDGSGTHCSDESFDGEPVYQHPLSVGDIPVTESESARQAFIRFFKSQQPTLTEKIKKRIRPWLPF